MKNSSIVSQIFFLLLSLVFFSVQAQDLEKEIEFSNHKYLPFYNLKKIGNAALFQGNREKKQYFEGWYFKMVAEDGSSILSVIPGISLSSDGKEQHAFIQVINGLTAETYYYSYPIEEFSFSKKEFAVKIGDNFFSEDKIILNLKDDAYSVVGTVDMFNSVEYKSNRFLSPGIMGWYRFVPFMECYHGVVCLTNDLKGELIVNDESFNFSNGKAYIEKDWGSSMPSSWIWMQSNNFNNSNSSIMLSIADIPWLGKSFVGFLGFFYYDNQIYHFATYRHTKLKLEITDSNLIKIRIENRKNAFILEVKSNNTGLLKAPIEGSMDRRIPESIDATLKITMLDKKGQIVYVDSTNITGLEMVGDYRKLQGWLK
ncbi:MAG: hypothetical protein JXR36_08605 [Bacteroidales bacterium]|nr:hypothetical protein [Bacteroidales bacterium]